MIMKRTLVLVVAASMLALLAPLNALSQEPLKPTRDIKIISSAGASAIVNHVMAWGKQNNRRLTIAVVDWGGNLIQFNAGEGAEVIEIDTALWKAKSALRWRRPNSETMEMVKKGDNLAPNFIAGDFPQPGGVPIVLNGQTIGAVGISTPDGEDIAKRAIDEVFKGQAKITAR
jgi:glc operon protein GlcG